MSLEHDPGRLGGSRAGPAFLTPRELAARWRMSARSLERWRAAGEGPCWLRLKGAVLYPLDGVRAWERAQTRGPAD